MHIHFVIHEAFEGPGHLLTWVRQRGYASSFSRLYLGEILPTDVSDIDLLIIMGGPQTPATTLLQCPHFDAGAEKALIRDSIDAGKAVLGICLGAQLIGEALGARYESSPHREIGQYPITLTEDGLADAMVSHFGRRALVGHWHDDMPGLTPDSRILAHSAGCPRQIVVYSPLVYGFQCHLEFTTDSLDAMIAHAGVAFDDLAEQRYVQSQAEIRCLDHVDMNGLLAQFMDKLVSAYLVNRGAEVDNY